jgi:hypothetical protein
MLVTQNLGAEDRAPFVAGSKGFVAFYGALALLLVAGAAAWHPSQPKGLANAFDAVATVRLEKSLQDTRALKLSQLR